MTELVLVRHGQSIWHAENRYAGSSDIALTPRGYKDAELLANWARTTQLDAVWVSPLSRARATAAQVVQVTGLQPRVDARLRELSFGQGEGRTIAEIEQMLPGAVSAFREDPVAHYFPDGEDPREAVKRATACFQEITRLYPDGRVLVVAHATLLRLELCHLMGVPLSQYRVIFPVMHNGALTEIRLAEDKFSLLSFNIPIEVYLVPAYDQEHKAQAMQ